MGHLKGDPWKSQGGSGADSLGGQEGSHDHLWESVGHSTLLHTRGVSQIGTPLGDPGGLHKETREALWTWRHKQDLACGTLSTVPGQWGLLVSAASGSSCHVHSAHLSLNANAVQHAKIRVCINSILPQA